LVYTKGIYQIGGGAGRDGKQVIDQVAAVSILQSFLDRRAGEALRNG